MLVFFYSEKFLLVAGGVGNQGLSSVEVISLDESNVPLPDCLKLLGNLDYVSYWSGGAPLRRGLAKRPLLLL